MSDYVNKYKQKVNPEEVRSRFSEITESETPIWSGGPSALSMIGRYALAILVLLIHLIFFWAAKFENVNGEGNLNLVIGLAKVILDISGVFGFVIVMLLIAKINHYLNVSTSGGWTTSWLVLNGLIPFTIVILDWSGKLLGNFTEGVPDTPMWLDWYYPLLGVLSSSFAIAMTTHYRNAFQYAITDKRVHIRKKFLYLDTSAVGIPFDKVENLKVDPPIIGKILGFGSLHIITDGGVNDENHNINHIEKDTKSGVFRLMFGWIFAQRSRGDFRDDPSSCLHAISEPMEVYRLINELMDE
ncbi:MAG: hypothetical protein CMB53_00565 [Euryarchaeota archaeon]|nr:hypothetical protein [Euryarchaeota archaeon]|tara:strand:+ start:9771 stop:10667 length:897 start_codon:yes stop_codon:yes gene_type:complete